jgi:hypothetical protein
MFWSQNMNIQNQGSGRVPSIKKKELAVDRLGHIKPGGFFVDFFPVSRGHK